MDVDTRCGVILHGNIVQLSPLKIVTVGCIVLIETMQFTSQCFDRWVIIDMKKGIGNSDPFVLISSRAENNGNGVLVETLHPVFFGDVCIAFGVFEGEIETIVGENRLHTGWQTFVALNGKNRGVKDRFARAVDIDMDVLLGAKLANVIFTTGMSITVGNEPGDVDLFAAEDLEGYGF